MGEVEGARGGRTWHLLRRQRLNVICGHGTSVNARHGRAREPGPMQGALKRARQGRGCGRAPPSWAALAGPALARQSVESGGARRAARARTGTGSWSDDGSSNLGSWSLITLHSCAPQATTSEGQRSVCHRARQRPWRTCCRSGPPRATCRR